jgi:hypothetical protein
VRSTSSASLMTKSHSSWISLAASPGTHTARSLSGTGCSLQGGCLYPHTHLPCKIRRRYRENSNRSLAHPESWRNHPSCLPIRYPHPSLSDTSHTHSVYLTRRGVCIHMLSPCKTRGTYMHSVYRTGRDVHIYIPPCSAQGELCCPHIPSCKISHMTAQRASHREGCHVTFIRSVHIHPPCMARIYRPAAPAGISAITDRHPRLQPHSSHTHTRVRARAPLCTPLCTLCNLQGGMAVHTQPSLQGTP